jgi:hypothetical protein
MIASGHFAIKHCVSISLNTFIAMQPLEVYYLNQAGRCLTHSGDRPCLCSPALPTALARHRHFFRQFLSVYPTPTVVRGQSCGSRDVAYRRQDSNRYCRELVTRSEPQGIVSKHVTESVQNLIGILRGGGRKRARGVTSVTKKAKRVRVIKRVISIFKSVTRHHVRCGGHVSL